MRLYRSLLALITALLLISGAMAPARADEAGVRNIYIRGNRYPGAYGEIVGNYATLQVRRVLKALDYEWLVWSPEDGSTTLYGAPESPVVIRPGDPVMRLKDRTVTLPIAPYVKDGRLYAPPDFFREAVGVRVEWVTATHEIEITPPPYNQVGEFGPPGAGPAAFSDLGRDGVGRLYLTVATGPRQGLWRSADHGATWEQVGYGLTGLPGHARLIAGSGETAYLLLEGRLWTLAPESDQWTQLPNLGHGLFMDAAVRADGELWAVLDNLYEDGKELYRFNRENGEWVREYLNSAMTGLTTDTEDRLWAYGKWSADRLQEGQWTPVQWEPTFRVFQIAVSPDDPHWVWALTHEGVRVSQDGGQTWQTSPLPFQSDPADYASYRLVPGVGQELFLLTGERGVLYSPTGGGQWFRLTGYWPDARVLDATMDGERLFLATTSGGVIIPQRMSQPNAQKLPRLAPRHID